MGAYGMKAEYESILQMEDLVEKRESGDRFKQNLETDLNDIFGEYGLFAPLIKNMDYSNNFQEPPPGSPKEKYAADELSIDTFLKQIRRLFYTREGSSSKDD